MPPKKIRSKESYLPHDKDSNAILTQKLHRLSDIHERQVEVLNGTRIANQRNIARVAELTEEVSALTAQLQELSDPRQIIADLEAQLNALAATHNELLAKNDRQRVAQRDLGVAHKRSLQTIWGLERELSMMPGLRAHLQAVMDEQSRDKQLIQQLQARLERTTRQNEHLSKLYFKGLEQKLLEPDAELVRLGSACRTLVEENRALRDALFQQPQGHSTYSSSLQSSGRGALAPIGPPSRVGALTGDFSLREPPAYHSYSNGLSSSGLMSQMSSGFRSHSVSSSRDNASVGYGYGNGLSEDVPTRDFYGNAAT